jgi:hypothetical protein
MEIKKIIRLFGIMMVVCFGCNPKSPLDKDVVGKWGHSSGAVLIIKEDGTFTGAHLPLNYLLTASKTTVFNGTGKWKLKQDQGRWVIGLDFDTTSVNDHKNGFTTIILISGSGILENKAPWYLFLWMEEEGGERYKFSKI